VEDVCRRGGHIPRLLAGVPLVAVLVEVPGHSCHRWNWPVSRFT
jgi:hypothetical protein